MECQYAMAESTSRLLSRDSPTRNSNGCASGFHSGPLSTSRSAEPQSRMAWSSCGPLAPSGQVSCNASAAAITTCSSSDRGMNARTAAWTLGCIRTVRTGVAGSMVTKPTRARLPIARRTRFWSAPPAVLGWPVT
jgi:hypothetical protein